MSVECVDCLVTTSPEKSEPVVCRHGGRLSREGCGASAYRSAGSIRYAGHRAAPLARAGVPCALL